MTRMDGELDEAYRVALELDDAKDDRLERRRRDAAEAVLALWPTVERELLPAAHAHRLAHPAVTVEP
jgi:hypothetical protein